MYGCSIVVTGGVVPQLIAQGGGGGVSRGVSGITGQADTEPTDSGRSTQGRLRHPHQESGRA